jgi:hypothetical protein
MPLSPSHPLHRPPQPTRGLPMDPTCPKPTLHYHPTKYKATACCNPSLDHHSPSTSPLYPLNAPVPPHDL